MDRRKLLTLSATGVWGAGLGSPIRRVGTQDTPVFNVGAAPRLRNSALSSVGGFLSVRDFGAAADGIADDTAAVQRAINHVRDQVAVLQDTSHLPRIELPAGRYRLTDTINTTPWIKLCSSGSVLLDFERLPLDQNGIVCRNEIMLPPGDLCYPGNRSPFLDGTGGTISILGPGVSRSNGWGIVTGNRDARFLGEVRDAGGRNVVVTGWRGALRIDPINTYLNAWTSCRFEQNREAAIYVPALQGPSVNSGERMTFYDCTFSGSMSALHVDSDSQDFFFDACSFDFNRDVIYFGPHAGYGTVALSHCHIEGVDGMIVNATTAGDRLRVAMNHSIVLPRRWNTKGSQNAPRKLVAGRCSFAATAVEFRFEAPVDNAGEVLIGDEVHVETLNGLSFQGFDVLPSRNRCLNADAEFHHDALGTSVEGLSHWKSGAGNHSVASAAIARINAGGGRNRIDRDGRALVLKAPSAGGAKFALSTRSTFVVQPAETVCAACGVSYEGAPGNSVVSIDFLAVDGGLLARAETLGAGDKGIAILRATVPAGASYASLSAGFSNWSGELLVKSLAVWRAA